jgi:hypothetical protein
MSVQPKWSITTLLAWAMSETRCTCTGCMPADVVTAKQVIIDLFGGRDDLGFDRGVEVFQSEDLGYLMLVIGSSMHRLGPELARDVGAALFTHADRAASEVPCVPISPDDRQRAESLSRFLKSKGEVCGDIIERPAGLHLCIMTPGHSGPHGGPE